MTPDQEKELQKAAERYKYETIQALLTKGGNTPSISEIFIAGAKHQDAISRRDERERMITLFQDKFDSNRDYFGTDQLDAVKNIFQEVVEETTK